MLKNIVLQQKLEKEQIFTVKQMVERSQKNFGDKWLNSSLIKVILGPRRAGKSVFSHMLLKNTPYMYFNFDDEFLAGQKKLNATELSYSIIKPEMIVKWTF
jgi:uncharacterized protein